MAERIQAAAEQETGLQRAASMAELMETLGWKHPRMRRLVELWPEIVIHSDGRGSGAPKMLDAERVRGIVSTVEAALSIPEAAAALGVSHPVCRQLVDGGLLQRLEERFVDIHEVSASEILVERASVDGIIARLKAGAQGGTAARPLSLRAVVSSVTLLGLGPADVVGLMLDGRLRYHPAPPTRSRRKGPFPFTIDGASVDLFCAEGRRDLPMAVKSAAADLRWNQQTVLSMLRAGEIRALSGKAMFGATVIPRAEVARAKLEYATTAQVGARLIPEPSMGFLRMLARELRRLGLEPVVGDGGAAGRTGQLIWRAGDVTAADHDALSAWARRFGRTQTKRQRAGSGGRKP